MELCNAYRAFRQFPHVNAALQRVVGEPRYLAQA